MRGRLAIPIAVALLASVQVAVAQTDERRDRFVTFVERAVESARALEEKARAVAEDIASTDEFARAERSVKEIGDGMSNLAATLGEKTEIKTITADMRSWVAENRQRIAELDDISRANRAQLETLWRRQDRLVEEIGRRLEEIQTLAGENYALLAEEKAVRMEMARVGAARTSRRAQILAAQEIDKLARELALVRKKIEESVNRLSPES